MMVKKFSDMLQAGEPTAWIPAGVVLVAGFIVLGWFTAGIVIGAIAALLLVNKV